MHPQERFKLSRQAMLLATISAAFPVTGYAAAAGRADFVIGNVEAVAPNGSRRPLGRGDAIQSGEAINTGENARAQVRFADGGFISLQPNTLFRIDEFNYQNKTDGGEKGFFSLLKGGLRAITGAIGHVNRNTYRVTTPSATIGIRGTGYNAALRDDGLFVNVGEGAISLTNNAGLLIVTAGGAAFVADFNSSPRPSAEHPHTPPAGLQSSYNVGEHLDSSGNLISLPVGLVSGPGYAMSWSYADGCSGSCTDASYLGNSFTNVDALFSGSSQLLSYYADYAGGEGGVVGAATVSFSATDGIIGWGRWDGNTSQYPSQVYWPHPLTNGQFHYVIGIPTATMPTTGVATYSLMGYTNPSATDGTTGWTVNGTLTADFLISEVAVNNLTIARSGGPSYVLSGSLNVSGAGFAGDAWSACSGSQFNITGSGSGACMSGCFANVNGFFAGTNASRAGLSYFVDDTLGAKVTGTAAFIGGAMTASPQQQVQ